MKMFGLLFGNHGRRKFRELHNDEFERNLSDAALRSLGYRVRKFNLKPAVPAYYGA